MKRYTEDSEEIVVLPYLAIFYWLMWPTMVLWILAAVSSATGWYIAAGIASALVLVTAIPHWPVTWELKRKMRESSITASGSKYSFSNPLTYRWPKSHVGQTDEGG